MRAYVYAKAKSAIIALNSGHYAEGYLLIPSEEGYHNKV
jgi:hypothetical protein